MPALSDLRTIASAFRDLARAQAVSATSAADARAAQPPPAPIEQLRDIIYTAADADVAPPVVKSQKMPPWRPAPQATVQEFRGVLRLLIDQTGAVVSAAMAASTVPMYDSLLVRAARDWKFLPAQKQGTPVRYLKLIEIQLKPTAP